MQKKKGTVEKQKSCPFHTIEELYTAVKKKPKGNELKDEEEIPQIPPHTVEELYTAVRKKPKSQKVMQMRMKKLHHKQFLKI